MVDLTSQKKMENLVQEKRQNALRALSIALNKDPASINETTQLIQREREIDSEMLKLMGFS